MLHPRYGLRPNNSFKPKPLRYGKLMAEKACHDFASTTQFGLTQVLAGIRLAPQMRDLLSADVRRAAVHGSSVNSRKRSIIRHTSDHAKPHRLPLATNVNACSHLVAGLDWFVHLVLRSWPQPANNSLNPTPLRGSLVCDAPRRRRGLAQVLDQWR